MMKLKNILFSKEGQRAFVVVLMLLKLLFPPISHCEEGI